MKIKKLAKWLHSGTFSRTQHRNNYRDHKFNREIDIFVDYINQLPYLKVIGAPVAVSITLVEFSPIILMVAVESIKNIKNK